MDLNSNRFQWVLSFSRDVANFLSGEDSLRTLANSLCMLGIGKDFNEATETYEFTPNDSVQLEMNEIIHSMLKGERVLRELRGFFTYDSELDEEHPLKIASKPYDKDLVAFLSEDPDPRYFRPKS